MLDALRFDQLVFFLKLLDALAQFDLDGLDGAHCRRARRHVMAGRINRETRHALQDMAGQRIENLDAFDFIIEQRNPYRSLRAFRGEDVEHVAAHAEHATLEFNVVALVLHRDQPLDGIAL